MTTTLDYGRQALRPDCGNCFALCCTAFGFSRSADFAIDKPAGSPCPNLSADFSCSIHERLAARGFRGCTTFDCLGAGQAASALFPARPLAPELRRQLFAVFKILRQLHEMLWYLAEAQARTFDPDAARTAQGLAGTIQAAVRGGTPALLGLDLAALHGRVREILVETSEEVRAAYRAADDDQPGPAPAPGADLAGADLSGRRLCGADLRGALLIAADLRGADLAAADLLGADLRDARLEGADLSAALYLVPAQVNAARGNAATRLPAGLQAPPHWRS